MIWKEQDLINITVNCRLSTQNDEILIAINSEKNIEVITIKYDLNTQDIKVEFCDFKDAWQSVDKANIERIDDKIELNFYEEKEIKCIKIIASNLKTEDIQIFVRKYKGLIVSAPPSGWGDRLIALLHAMNFSQLCGFKFGFVWMNINHSYENNVSLKQVEPINIEDENYIFNQEFIKNYSYTNSLKAKLKSMDKRKIADISKKPFDYTWGYYTAHSTRNYWIDAPKNFTQNYKELWENIGFSKEIKQILKEVQNIADDLQKKYKDKEIVAIHTRTGDIAYSIPFFMWMHTKSTPTEIAYELSAKALQEKKVVVLFGDDKAQVKELVKHFDKQGDIHTIDEFLPQNLSPTQRALMEIQFMSNCQQIITNSGSGFARLASIIGHGKEPTSWGSIFTLKEQYEIFKKNAEKIHLHPLQNAFSYFYLFYLHTELFAQDLVGLEKIAKKILEFNNGYFKFYQLLYVGVLMKLGKISEANLELKKLQSNEFYLKSRLGNWFINAFSEHKALDYAYISFVLAHIKLEQTKNTQALILVINALRLEPENKIFKDFLNKILQNHFKELIEDVNFKDTLTKLFKNQEQNLISQIQTLNNEKNSLQNSLNSLPTKKAKLEIQNLEQDLNLKKLEELKLKKELGENFIQNISVNFINPNSAKARIHNHLAYKLGSAMIENSKSIWGYIRMPYVLSYIKEKHKKDILINSNLPHLESYADYQEALKEKECFTYKLGLALMKAHKNWYKGGYLKFYFKDVPSLKRGFGKKS